jgi:hypothetical protein
MLGCFESAWQPRFATHLFVEQVSAILKKRYSKKKLQLVRMCNWRFLAWDFYSSPPTN